MKSVRLATPAARQLAASYCMEAPENWRVKFEPPTRSVEQNALMWTRLHQLARELTWDGERLTAHEWKDLLSACLRKQKVVRGIEGGLVFLGERTSRMSKDEMSNLLDLMDAFAAQRGVVFEDRREMTR